MTLDQYTRMFGPPVAPPVPGPRPPGRPAHSACTPARVPRELVHETAAALLGSEDFVARLAEETSELLFTTQFRDRLRLSVAQLLNTRLELHAQAVAHLQRVREELAQPWRIEAGGADGEPTPTPHLVAMAGEVHHELVKAEEALLKTTRLALEESRQSHEALAGLGGRPAFTGEAEVIPVPPELDAAERETVRSLMHLLRKEVEARATKARTSIPAEHSPVVEAHAHEDDWEPLPEAEDVPEDIAPYQGEEGLSRPSGPTFDTDLPLP